MKIKLERYNQICLSVVFTLGILGALAGLCGIIFAQFSRHKRVRVIDEIRLDDKKGVKTQKMLDIITPPLGVSGSRFFYSPIYKYDTTKKENDFSLDNFKSYQSVSTSYFYQSDKGYGFWGCSSCNISNVVLINRANSRSHKMFSKPVLIDSFLYPREDESSSLVKGIKRNFILYSRVSSDFNKDKKLSRKDGYILFTSSLNGENRKAITPKNSHYLDFKIDDDNNRFYVRVKVDSNKNNKFDNLDKVELYSSPLDDITKLDLIVW